MEITKIEKCIKAKDRYNIHLDGQFSFSLFTGTVLDLGLFVGKKISEQEKNSAILEDEKRKALNSAYHLLSFRARSRKEISDRLQKKGFLANTIDEVIQKLERYDLLDDKKFAESWVRERSGKRGKILLRVELFQKGIGEEIINKILESVDKEKEIEAAREIVSKKFSIQKETDNEKIYRRARDLLLRKGFAYDVVNEVLKTEMKKGR